MTGKASNLFFGVQSHHRMRGYAFAIIFALSMGSLHTAVPSVAEAARLSFPTGKGWVNPAGTAPYEDWGFGVCNSAYEGGAKKHLGADSQGYLSGPVRAMASGTVIARMDWSPKGAALAVTHVAADGSKFIAIYGHLSSPAAVGTRLQRGQQLGTIFADGGNSHLHLGIRPYTGDPMAVPRRGTAACGESNHGYVNPIPWLASKGAPVPAAPRAPSCTSRLDGGLGVAWPAPTNSNGTITGYQMQYKNINTGAVVTKGTGTARSYTIASSAVTANHRYQMRARARNQVGWGPWSAWSGACANKVNRSIRSVANGRYVAAEINSTGGHYGKLRARATSVGTWERFTVYGDCRSTAGCAFRSHANGKYVSAERDYTGSGYGMLRARAASRGAWEIFSVHGDCASSTGCGIKARANSRFVSAELNYTGGNYGMLRARATSIGGWERFRIGPA